MFGAVKGGRWEWDGQHVKGRMGWITWEGEDEMDNKGKGGWDGQHEKGSNGMFFGSICHWSSMEDGVCWISLVLGVPYELAIMSICAHPRK